MDNTEDNTLDCSESLAEELSKAQAKEEETDKKTEEAKDGTEASKEENVDYGTRLMTDNIYQDDEAQVNPELVHSLTNGFVAQFMPQLQKAKSMISQIVSSQNVLIETVEQENSKFAECLTMDDLDKVMTKAKTYHQKLLKLRKDMTLLHEKSSKVKKRALRLQQQKQKDELTRAHDMEKEFEKERMLTARVSSTTD